MLVSAERDGTFDQAAASAADQIIIDLEDAIDPSRKHACRAVVIRWLSTGGSAWVRINDRTSPFWAQDVAELQGTPGLRGVVLAKSDEAEHVADTWEAMGRSTPIVALVESALGIENATAIARAQGTFRLAFGSGDYRRDTGTAAEDLALAYPRSRLVVASRVGHLPGPIDGPSVGLMNAPLREACRKSVALGLTGKLCLEPLQLDTLNAEIGPSTDDVAWAMEILSDFEARGRVVRDGSDLPRVGRAERITELARAFGLLT
jgi:citrate lyase subunit beta/citryl-CoA lyase